MGQAVSRLGALQAVGVGAELPTAWPHALVEGRTESEKDSARELISREEL